MASFAGRRPRGRERRVTVALACEVCGSRNFHTTRVARDGVTPLKLKKFCPQCNAHRVHEETR